MLFVVNGKTSVGKDTICRALKESDLGLIPLVRCTTRPKRPGEVEGKTYYYTTREQFLQEKAEGKVIEWEEYETPQGTWNYYTRFSDMEPGKDYITLGSLAVFNQLYSVLGDKVVSIYIALDDLTRIKRALKREEESGDKCNVIEMCRRFYDEFISYKSYDMSHIGKVFENYDFDSCMSEIVEYINYCRSKT